MTRSKLYGAYYNEKIERDGNRRSNTSGNNIQEVSNRVTPMKHHIVMVLYLYINNYEYPSWGDLYTYNRLRGTPTIKIDISIINTIWGGLKLQGSAFTGGYFCIWDNTRVYTPAKSDYTLELYDEACRINKVGKIDFSYAASDLRRVCKL